MHDQAWRTMIWLHRSTFGRLFPRRLSCLCLTRKSKVIFSALPHRREYLFCDARKPPLIAARDQGTEWSYKAVRRQRWALQQHLLSILFPLPMRIPLSLSMLRLCRALSGARRMPEIVEVERWERALARVSAEVRGCGIGIEWRGLEAGEVA